MKYFKRDRIHQAVAETGKTIIFMADENSMEIYSLDELEREAGEEITAQEFNSAALEFLKDAAKLLNVEIPAKVEQALGWVYMSPRFME